MNFKHWRCLAVVLGALARTTSAEQCQAGGETCAVSPAAVNDPLVLDGEGLQQGTALLQRHAASHGDRLIDAAAAAAAVTDDAQRAAAVEVLAQVGRAAVHQIGEFLDPSFLEPTPLRQEDKDFLALLNTSEGTAIVERAWKALCKVPADWAGPARRPEDGLWGGPSRKFAEARFVTKTFPTEHPELTMDFAGPGSGIPEGLEGIWWMDQTGFSSVAKDPSYPFNMQPVSEILASFGPKRGDGNFVWGSYYQADTRCVTPVTLYGGQQWASFDANFSKLLFDAHQTTRNVLSFCFRNDEVIDIYQKMLLSEASIFTQRIGPVMAQTLGYYDAGDGYVWTPGSILNMSMVRKPWGWDRVTTVLDAVHQLTPLQEAFLKSVLPIWAWGLVKLAQKLQRSIVSHYPLMQVIDGKGQRTRFFDEFAQFMTYIPDGGKNLYYAMPE